MVDLETARKLCLSLPEVDEYDHFGKPAYRAKKKIFATLWVDDKRVVVKLSKSEQTELCEENYQVVFPVKNKWGEMGWTNIDLNKVSETLFKKLLKSAWINVAAKTIVKKFNV